MSDQPTVPVPVKTFYARTPSPIGVLLLMATSRGLSGLHMENGKHGPTGIGADWLHDPVAFTDVAEQLQQYFAGTLTRFDTALDMQGTAFQQSVWQALLAIPYGQTISYGELARHIDHPKAVRAVGLANGRNPVSIIVPCHRVIGANGSLTGYGGGMERKKFLLELEAGALL